MRAPLNRSGGRRCEPHLSLRWVSRAEDGFGGVGGGGGPKEVGHRGLRYDAGMRSGCDCWRPRGAEVKTRVWRGEEKGGVGLRGCRGRVGVGWGVQIQASSAVGLAAKKTGPCRGNNNRQIAKIYTYIPIHERIHTAGGSCRKSLRKLRVCGWGRWQHQQY